MQAHLLSSLVHSVLRRRTRIVSGNNNRADADEDCSEDQIVAGIEAMLHSLVERMAKCEPEDFELVRPDRIQNPVF